MFDKPSKLLQKRGEQRQYKKTLIIPKRRKRQKDKTEQDKTRPGKTRQGKARQGKARQDHRQRQKQLL
jgi:hypothetical protein